MESAAVNFVTLLCVLLSVSAIEQAVAPPDEIARREPDGDHILQEESKLPQVIVLPDGEIKAAAIRKAEEQRYPHRIPDKFRELMEESELSEILRSVVPLLDTNKVVDDKKYTEPPTKVSAVQTTTPKPETRARLQSQPSSLVRNIVENSNAFNRQDISEKLIRTDGDIQSVHNTESAQKRFDLQSASEGLKLTSDVELVHPIGKSDQQPIKIVEEKEETKPKAPENTTPVSTEEQQTIGSDSDDKLLSYTESATETKSETSSEPQEVTTKHLNIIETTETVQDTQTTDSVLIEQTTTKSEDVKETPTKPEVSTVKPVIVSRPSSDLEPPKIEIYDLVKNEKDSQHNDERIGNDTLVENIQDSTTKPSVNKIPSINLEPPKEDGPGQSIITEITNLPKTQNETENSQISLTSRSNNEQSSSATQSSDTDFEVTSQANEPQSSDTNFEVTSQVNEPTTQKTQNLEKHEILKNPEVSITKLEVSEIPQVKVEVKIPSVDLEAPEEGNGFQNVVQSVENKVTQDIEPIQNVEESKKEQINESENYTSTPVNTNFPPIFIEGVQTTLDQIPLTITESVNTQQTETTTQTIETKATKQDTIQDERKTITIKEDKFARTINIDSGDATIIIQVKPKIRIPSFNLEPPNFKIDYSEPIPAASNTVISTIDPKSEFSKTASDKRESGRQTINNFINPYVVLHQTQPAIVQRVLINPNEKETGVKFSNPPTENEKGVSEIESFVPLERRHSIGYTDDYRDIPNLAKSNENQLTSEYRNRISNGDIHYLHYPMCTRHLDFLRPIIQERIILYNPTDFNRVEEKATFKNAGNLVMNPDSRYAKRFINHIDRNDIHKTPTNSENTLYNHINSLNKMQAQTIVPIKSDKWLPFFVNGDSSLKDARGMDTIYTSDGGFQQQGGNRELSTPKQLKLALTPEREFRIVALSAEEIENDDVLDVAKDVGHNGDTKEVNGYSVTEENIAKNQQTQDDGVLVSDSPHSVKKRSIYNSVQFPKYRDNEFSQEKWSAKRPFDRSEQLIERIRYYAHPEETRRFDYQPIVRQTRDYEPTDFNPAYLRGNRGYGFNEWGGLGIVQ